MKTNTNLYQEVVDTVDIVPTVAKYVTNLTLKGSYYEGRCPFDASCGESFCVSGRKKEYYCFGCHSRGTVIDFIAKIGSMNKMTAAKFLSNLKKAENWNTATTQEEYSLTLRYDFNSMETTPTGDTPTGDTPTGDTPTGGNPEI